MKPVIDLSDEIHEDQQSKELLLAQIIDDERASIRWIKRHVRKTTADQKGWAKE